MTKKITLAQRACFYKFEPDHNLKECEKISGSQFDVFDDELERHQDKPVKTKGLALDMSQQARMNAIKDQRFIREQSAYLADYDLSF